MKVFCSICLGNYMQNVSIIDDKGLVGVEQVPTPELSVYLAALKDKNVDTITLKGPEVFIKKVQEETEYQIEDKTINFILQS